MYPYFTIGGRLVSTYTLAHVAGVVAGVALGYLGLRQIGFSRRRSLACLGILALTAHFSAHFYHVVTHPLEYRWNARALANVWTEGLALHGGLAGALGGILVLSWVWKVSCWKIGDALVPGGCIALFLFRIGCYLKGCCFGRPCGEDFFLAGVSVKLIHNVRTSLHPTQLYCAAAALGLFALLRHLERRKLFDGEVVIAGMLVYSAWRFTVEFVRNDSPKHIEFLSTRLDDNQIFTVLFFALGLFFLALRRVALREGLRGR